MRFFRRSVPAVWAKCIVPAILDGTYQYSVTRDGKPFLVNVTTDEAVGTPITIVLNWTSLPK
jgi:hypothetical protein